MSTSTATPAAATPMSSNNEDVTIVDLLSTIKTLILTIWARATRRARITSALVLFLILSVMLAAPRIREMPLPTISLEYADQPFNKTKVALLIENRPNPILAPLMLHFMSVVPPDWRFRFMGSVESVESIGKSRAIQEQVRIGKLDLTYIPANMSTAGQEMISRFLTNLWLYEQVLQPAEYLLVFQTDSILCANSRHNIDEYLEYDWVGAPWNPNGRWGGNGGLSIRRVSTIIDVLRHQVRVDGSEPEDVWLAERIGHHPGRKVANGTTSLTFSGEMHSGVKEKIDDKEAILKYGSLLKAAEAGVYVSEIDSWRDGFYEPMGYHTGGSGKYLHGGIWGSPELRKHLWNYCPEVKMTLAMDAAKYMPGECNANWKRDLQGEGEGDVVPEHWEEVEYPYGTEIIDGKEYPLLPPGLVPW